MSLYKCRHSEGQLSPFHVFLQVHFFRPRIPFRIEERRLLSRRELGKWVYTRLKFFRQYSTVIIFTGRFVSIRSLPLNHPSNLTRLTLPNLQRSLTFSKATEKEFLLFRGEKSISNFQIWRTDFSITRMQYSSPRHMRYFYSVQEEKCCLLFAGRNVRIGKNCARGTRPRPIRTDLGRQIMCLLFFPLENYFMRNICVDFSVKQFHTVRVR